MKQLLAGCFKTAAEELAVYEKSTEIDPKTRKSKGIVDPRGIPKDIEELIRRLKPIDKDMKKRAEVRSRQLSFYHIHNVSALAYLIALL